MAKHSKYKNTGILYELLVRQIATETLNNKATKAMGIIKSHFNKGTQLGKELVLYQNLVKEKFDTEAKAKTFVTAAIKARRKINIKELDQLGRKFRPQGAILKVDMDKEHWLTVGCGESRRQTCYPGSKPCRSRKQPGAPVPSDVAESGGMS